MDWVPAGDLEDVTSKEVNTGPSAVLRKYFLFSIYAKHLMINVLLQDPDAYKDAWSLLKVLTIWTLY